MNTIYPLLDIDKYILEFLDPINDIRKIAGLNRYYREYSKTCFGQFSKIFNKLNNKGLTNGKFIKLVDRNLHDSIYLHIYKIYIDSLNLSLIILYFSKMDYQFGIKHMSILSSIDDNRIIEYILMYNIYFRTNYQNLNVIKPEFLEYLDQLVKQKFSSSLLIK